LEPLNDVLSSHITPMKKFVAFIIQDVDMEEIENSVGIPINIAEDAAVIAAKCKQNYQALAKEKGNPHIANLLRILDDIY